MLTERDLTEGGGADEAPPFLLETTEFVRPPAEGLRPAGPSRVESLIETVQQQRPPYELMALLGLVGALVLLFLFRPSGDTEVADPLSAAGTSSAVTDPNAPSTGDGELGNLAAVPGAQVQTLPLPSTSEQTPETLRTTTTVATTTTSESTTSSSLDDESTTSTEQPTTTEPPTTVGGVQPLGNCVVETRNNTEVYAIPDDDDDNLLGRVGRGSFPAVARQDNWFLLQFDDVQGWIKRGRIRDASGDCG
ncbi:MAG: hypothetical protein AAF962_10065 [Actinomycetota bacterium]